MQGQQLGSWTLVWNPRWGRRNLMPIIRVADELWHNLQLGLVPNPAAYCPTEDGEPFKRLRYARRCPSVAGIAL